MSEPFSVRDGSHCLKKEQIGPLKTSKKLDLMLVSGMLKKFKREKLLTEK